MNMRSYRLCLFMTALFIAVNVYCAENSSRFIADSAEDQDQTIAQDRRAEQEIVIGRPRVVFTERQQQQLDLAQELLNQANNSELTDEERMAGAVQLINRVMNEQVALLGRNREEQLAHMRAAEIREESSIERFMMLMRAMREWLYGLNDFNEDY